MVIMDIPAFEKEETKGKEFKKWYCGVRTMKQAGTAEGDVETVRKETGIMQKISQNGGEEKKKKRRP